MRALVVHQPGGPRPCACSSFRRPCQALTKSWSRSRRCRANPRTPETAPIRAGQGVLRRHMWWATSWPDASRPPATSRAGGRGAGGGLLPVRGTRWGTYAELVTLDAALVGPRPPASARSGPPRSRCAGATSVQLLDRLDPRPGEWVLVHGAAAWGRQPADAAGPGAGARVRRLGQRPAGAGCCASWGRRCSWTATPVPWPSGRAARSARSWTWSPNLVGYGTLAASLPMVREGGRAGSVVELAGDLSRRCDRQPHPGWRAGAPVAGACWGLGRCRG